MTLKDLIADRIRANGPIPVADYMADCLLHPEHGYYTTHDPLGATGDFTTAPEISQMFGELVGLSLAQSWMDQGQPERITVAELGPGRGTLMADILRVARAVPGFSEAAHVVLVEASPALRKAQRDTLQDHAVNWVQDAADLPGKTPLFLVANEFFDALPIRQFQRDGEAWREACVGLDGDRLVLGFAGPARRPDLDDRLADTADGDLVEICPAATAITGIIAARIAESGGAAVIVDYGDWRSLGDTLQAVRQHQSADILESPGQADLTAHVDFEALAGAAATAGCAHSRLTPQGVFLERLGITARAQALAGAPGTEAHDIVARAHHRLTHPDEMGNLFKVLGLFPPGAKPPPGLEP